MGIHQQVLSVLFTQESKAMTSRQIFNLCKEAADVNEVSTALSQLYSQNKVSRKQDGKFFAYWLDPIGNNNPAKPANFLAEPAPIEPILNMGRNIANQNTLLEWDGEQTQNAPKQEPSPRLIIKNEALQATLFNKSGSKYLREIKGAINGKLDVYAVIEMFAITCPARQHALKKILCTGLRGKGDELQDLREAKDAIERAMQLQQERLNQPDRS